MAETPEHDAMDVDAQEEQSGTATRLFDIRTVIGALFLVYGLLIGGAGLFDTDAASLVKSQGININLWTGVSMAILGALFLVWWRLRPTT